jgi:pilus assembly protein Flp/PilA
LKRLLGLIRDESGATAVEYGLIVTLIAVIIVAAVTALGANLEVKYNTISTNVSAAGA